MWRSYLASALGALSRNRLYAAINIAGLALGVTAALLIGLYVRDELTFDRFIPDYRQVYLVTTTDYWRWRDTHPWRYDAAKPELAARLKLELPEIAAVARVSRTRQPPRVSRGQVVDWETGFAWADPDLFVVLPLKAVAGDPRTALRTPDSVVLTRAAARKYFGRDAPIGETLLVDPATPHPMRVTAVVEELPSNASLKGEVFASGLAPYSTLALFDQKHVQLWGAYTFVRVRPGVSAAAAERSLRAFVARDYGGARLSRGHEFALHMTPLTRLHFAPASDDGFDSGAPENVIPRGDLAALWALAAIGVLIVVSASINFVTLMTARAGRRSVETGVRKAVGARRGDLVVQFLGETLLYVAPAMALAVAATELLLPYVNAALGRKIAFDYLRDPLLAAALVGGTLVLGGLAGAYPAFVLSGFRPVNVLRRHVAQSSAGDVVRKGLVTLQFAIMIGLAVAAATLWRQTLFSLDNRLKVDGSKTLMIEDACDFVAPQDSGARAFREQVAALPGVEAGACTSTESLSNDGEPTPVRLDGRSSVLNRIPVDFGGLESLGLRPLAGRFFVRGRGADGSLGQPGAARSAAVVVNESAARSLGLSNPAAAVGHMLAWRHRDDPKVAYTVASEIIGVAPDYTLDTRAQVRPLMFVVQPTDVFVVHVSGRDLPGTLVGIDRAWAATGHRMIHRHFLDQALQEMYAAVIVQGTAVGLGAGLAIVVAALGLFGLSAHAADQRTKEIGIRKAMGARSGDIVRLLLWQFSQPVLRANLIAWPVAWWVMNRWLSGFAYHVDLPFWLFLAAGGAALVIACATVLAHALLIARAAPATALRYE
jgi:putative ABC transport system permease protein